MGFVLEALDPAGTEIVRARFCVAPDAAPERFAHGRHHQCRRLGGLDWSTVVASFQYLPLPPRANFLPTESSGEYGDMVCKRRVLRWFANELVWVDIRVRFLACSTSG